MEGNSGSAGELFVAVAVFAIIVTVVIKLIMWSEQYCVICWLLP